MAAKKRRCRGTTKKGKACRAYPLKGIDYCRAHDRMRPDEDRFGSPEWSSRAGASPKPSLPKVMELMREHAEQEAEALVAAYFGPLSAEDRALALRAAEAVLDRLVGKPRQVTEVSGPDGGAVPLGVDLDDPEVARAAHDFLSKLTGP
jgi:hypothetical protein